MIIRANDGWGTHFEGVRGITLCGKAFDLSRDDVHREEYDLPDRAGPDCDHPHVMLCSDCHSIRNRNRVEGVAL
ncbi:hypothetical protein [Natrinema sp. DC36]|uniref:hypothetical protein n=1 Tax=Natrinema sp. DC36 TaxID=2878680 RepID=UPI001CEFC268|nr:hypothetical protein [Natrinema sp. DC36]